jgi:hypothetical protein
MTELNLLNIAEAIGYKNPKIEWINGAGWLYSSEVCEFNCYLDAKDLWFKDNHFDSIVKTLSDWLKQWT